MYEKIGDILISNRDPIPALRTYVKKKTYGEYRLLELEKINDQISYKPITIHVQNKYTFVVDLQNAYFNSRYSGLRLTLCNILKNKEILINGDGVGPYSICLAKGNKILYGIEINYAANRLAQLNKRINRIYNYYPLYGYSNFFVDTICVIRPTITYKELIQFKCNHLYFLFLHYRNIIPPGTILFTKAYSSKLVISLIYWKISNGYLISYTHTI